MPPRLTRTARGVSLVELLVGMVIALMIAGVAFQLVLMARARYARLADDALIEDRGSQALELIGLAVQQAGWITDTPASSPVRAWAGADASPSLVGQDNCGPAAPGSNGIRCSGQGQRNSDALLVRFAGRSGQPDGLRDDGAMLDCMGYGVPERIEGASDARAGWALLYVSRAGNNDPQLICRSPSRVRGRPQTGDGTSRGMVRGIETLQLLYTLVPMPNEPAMTVPADAVPEGQWHRVRYVHAAVVARGDRIDLEPDRTGDIPLIPLFPHLAGTVSGAQEHDTHFRPADRTRRRASFSATFTVRNALRCEVDAC